MLPADCRWSCGFTSKAAHHGPAGRAISTTRTSMAVSQLTRGLGATRRLLLDVLDLGLPVGTEFLDLLSPSSLAIWSPGAPWAPYPESQSHRQLASGLSCLVGFKNGTDGSVKLPPMLCWRPNQSRLHGHDQDGARRPVFPKRAATAIATSSCVAANSQLRRRLSAGRLRCAYCSQIAPQVMIDLSHANSSKQHRRQIDVGREVASQIAAGDQRIMGVMVEPPAGRAARHRGGAAAGEGVSVTDACISFEQTPATAGRTGQEGAPPAR